MERSRDKSGVQRYGSAGSLTLADIGGSSAATRSVLDEVSSRFVDSTKPWERYGSAGSLTLVDIGGSGAATRSVLDEVSSRFVDSTKPWERYGSAGSLTLVDIGGSNNQPESVLGSLIKLGDAVPQGHLPLRPGSSGQVVFKRQPSGAVTRDAPRHHDDRISGLIAAYGNPIQLPEGQEEWRAVERDVTVYRWFRVFEPRLRSFISEKMAAVFGPDWMKSQLPNGMLDQWRARAAQAGPWASKNLMSYADFTDYARIICRRDNWGRVFKIFFKRTEFVQESLFRLGEPRNCTMHFRETPDGDELLIFAEIKRFQKLLN
ncbi:hypothetical protein [Hansschlegelia sp.]|uniref:hypothetical protein n=1 Tax=Hansschlegelia sp. TaxID=2041892 RepID=UPI002CB7EF11|nr:hypothetical protein [Hansschlegelia sp.]HVI28153.1 hypothetical protein [Hansschlegelia sp.]